MRMDPQELRDRARQECAKRWDDASGGWSVRRRAYAAARQEPTAASHFYFDRPELGPLVAALREHCPDAVGAVLRQADSILAHEFDLLGYDALHYGAEIDWHRDAVHEKRTALQPWHQIRMLEFETVGDSKVTAELSRHQHLVTLAKAVCLTRDARYAEELVRQWRSWQLHNPYPLGINWASSLEVAFRSLSWIWCWRLLDFAGVLETRFERDLIGALALNAAHIERYLSTYSSPNTHLLGEGVGLFAIGTMCPGSRAARRWQTRGWAIVLREAERQVLADGMHFEQSLYYHVYALDFFLHARILAARNGMAIPPAFDATLVRMLEALRLLTQAGHAPRFGDDDGGRVFDGRRNRSEHMRDPLAIGAVRFERPELKAAAGRLSEEALWLLGPSAANQFASLPATQPPAVSYRLESSGVLLMAGRTGGEMLVMDAGALGAGNAGHGHADALSVELMAFGQRWLVDPGTFCYLSTGRERDAFRGTAAHNTLQVDGRDQAEPAGPFAWQAQPNVRVEAWAVGNGFRYARAAHDGYTRLAAPVVHERRVFHLPGRFWAIHDRATGKGNHDLALHWHVDPIVTATPTGATGVLLESPAGERLGLIAALEPGWSLELREGMVSSAYGRQEPAPVVRVSGRVALPASCVTLLQPLSARTPLATLTPLRAGNAWECSIGAERHWLVFGEGEFWQVGPWQCDAEFFYCGPAEDGQLQVAMCGGSELFRNGEALVRSRECLAMWETVTNRGATRQPGDALSPADLSRGPLPRIEARAAALREG